MKLAKKKTCMFCAGVLAKKDKDTYHCPYCGKDYFISVDKKKRWYMLLPVGTLTVAAAICGMALVIWLLVAYYQRSDAMYDNAERFSKVYATFLTEVYDEPVAVIDDKDLARMKYLKVEQEEGEYIFSYSFENPYDYREENSGENRKEDNKENYREKAGEVEKDFAKTIKTVRVDEAGYAPTNLQYFTGLTRVELYTGAWENYLLPEDNEIRSIGCVDGYSRYGKPEFFAGANYQTLEEVTIYEAEDLTDYSFIEEISGIKSFTLENPVIKDGAPFQEFEQLESLTLLNPEFPETGVYELVDGMLSIPSLKTFRIEGPGGWYLSDEEWNTLKEKYDGRVEMARE